MQILLCQSVFLIRARSWASPYYDFPNETVTLKSNAPPAELSTHPNLGAAITIQLPT